MLEKYKVVYKGGQDEIVEKKSRFIATVAPVESEEEALAFMGSREEQPENRCWMFFLEKKSETS